MPSWGDFETHYSGSDTSNKQRRIDNWLTELAAIHNRNISDAAIAHTIKQLLPYTDESIKAAIEWAKNERHYPAIADIVERTQLSYKKEESFKAPLPLTDEQKRSSDQMALLSMLWLHYEHGWRLHDFQNDLLGRLFGRDPTQALVEAKNRYSRDIVAAWMNSQTT